MGDKFLMIVKTYTQGKLNQCRHKYMQRLEAGDAQSARGGCRDDEPEDCCNSVV